ncbi:hypothetical protein, unknown function [Leishmania infantum JPCM5]|uniref:Uncharacterized protein n=2 Tax=Leishmania infantum TaxID=5671 RepID=A4I566_LEIIN|nr:hypothetical protein, unknown function [Leishmania infantum JPCM5]CAC9511866.1 hypothetical_protein_-_conserved [Leishmania infantum]CAM69934.1 hypothetical protein, unknown function [Leishmania infantum JPCM5]SUZ43852.1 hypothetical_protein_-_conserved [Leishmania infantum]|eukprot:XP_001466885.1 hypothetical protein, unknown function [Leishmania infantum JPCM5]
MLSLSPGNLSRLLHMRLALRHVCILLQAAALVALVAVSGSSSSMAVSSTPSSHHYSGSVGSDSDTSIDSGHQPSPSPPSNKPPLDDDEWANVTLKFFIIFVSVCAGAGVVAFIVILCAYCREYKLLETSDDSDTESVCSRTTSQSTSSGESESSSAEAPAYATPRQRHMPPPPAANEITAPVAYEEENDNADLPEPVMQADTQSNESSEFLFVPPETTPSFSDGAATAIQRTGSRLSLACSRRGLYRKER